MRNRLFKMLLSLAPVLLAMPNALADHVELNFPLHTGELKFYCTAIADMATMIKIDTHNIDLQGACKGEHVVRPGHLVMPTAVFNSFSFTTNQEYPRAGSITIDSPPNTPVQCVIGGAGGRLEYAKAEDFC